MDKKLGGLLSADVLVIESFSLHMRPDMRWGRRSYSVGLKFDMKETNANPTNNVLLKLEPELYFSSFPLVTGCSGAPFKSFSCLFWMINLLFATICQVGDWALPPSHEHHQDICFSLTYDANRAAIFASSIVS